MEQLDRSSNVHDFNPTEHTWYEIKADKAALAIVFQRKEKIIRTKIF